MIYRSHRFVLHCLLLACVFLGRTESAAASADIPFSITLSEAVTVTGTPRIALDVGGITQYATYASGSGTSTLTFTYTTQAGDVDLDGITVSSPIDLNGGTIKDLAGNNLTTLTFTPPNTTGIKVNHPSLSLDFINSDYIANGTHYATLPSFLTATGGSFTRASVGTYFDSAGNVQTATSGTPRFDYDPVTHVAKGILIEESRLNAVPNNTMQGAVAGTIGSGGAMPTGWSFTGAGLPGLSKSVALGTENGINYVDVRIFGTSAGGVVNIVMGASGSSAASGQTWTTSAFVTLSGGSTTNVSNWYLLLDSSSASNTYVETKGGVITAPTSGSLSQSRIKVSNTFANANTVKTASTYIQFLAAAASIDITIRIGLPQSELGAFITSPIPTSGSVVTRAADVLKIPTGSWYNAVHGTMFINVYDSRPAGSGIWASLGTTGSGDRCQMYSSGATMQMQNFDTSVAQVLATGGTRNYGTNKAAYALETNNFAFVSNGGTVGTDITGTIGTKTLLVLGRGADYSTDMINDHINSFKYYPTRVNNTQLQLLTQ